MGKKTVPGLFHGGAVVEGVEAKGCANVTRLAAAEPSGRSAAAELPGCLPGGRLRRRRWPGAASVVVHAFRWLAATISSLDLTWSVKERPPRRMTA